MAQHLLEPGEWGSISTTKVGDKWRARVRVRDMDGELRQAEKTAPLRKDAVNNLLAHLAERTSVPPPESDTEIVPIVGRTSMTAVIAEWLEDIETQGLRPTTRTKYRREGRKIEEVLGGHTVADMTVARCRDYLRTIAKKSPANAQMKRTMLKMIMDVAVRHGALPVNPVALVTGIEQPTKEVVRALSVDEIKHHRKQVEIWQNNWADGLSNSNKPEWLLPDLFDFACATGCRIGEILALQWKSFDFEACTVIIEATIGPNDDLNIEAFHYKWTKSDAGYRKLTIPESVMNRLVERRVDQGDNPLGAVFPTKRGTWRSTKTAHELLARFRDEAGLDPQMTWRWFRKSVATLLSETYGDEVAQAQMGHESVDTTKQFYVAKPGIAPDSTGAIGTFFD